MCAHWSLTEHGLQAHETGDEVVEVDGQVLLCVAQNNQLEYMVVQLEAWRGNREASLKM